MKFTFKKTPKIGMYSSFETDHTTIKFQKRVCGSIYEKELNGKYSISLMVEKTNTITDNNTNCSWTHIYFKKKSDTEKEAREMLNQGAHWIFEKYTIHTHKDQTFHFSDFSFLRLFISQTFHFSDFINVGKSKVNKSKQPWNNPNKHNTYYYTITYKTTN